MRAHHHKLSNLGPSPAAVTWREGAVCGDTSINPKLFDYPEHANGAPADAKQRHYERHVTAARQHCDACPVATQCLELGVTRRSDGVFAGVLLRDGKVVPTRIPVPS